MEGGEEEEVALKHQNPPEQRNNRWIPLVKFMGFGVGVGVAIYMSHLLVSLGIHLLPRLQCPPEQNN